MTAPANPLERLALGCGSFGGIGSAPEWFGRGLTEPQAFALMDAAWELGITHFDTADAYGGGRSELMIGAWMRARGVRPTLTTKTYNPMAADGDHGLAPARVARQCAASLQRLGVPRVDLYLAHEYDSQTPMAEALAAFDDLKASGRIRAYGVSNFTASQLQEALTAGNPTAVQNAYSLLARGGEAAVLALCAQRGVAYLAFGPLSGGWLAGRYRRGHPYPAGSRMTQRPEPYERLATAQTFDRLDRLQALATAGGRSMAVLALAWLLDEDRVSQVILGLSRPEHLEPVGEAIAHPLQRDERATLEQIFGP